MNRNLANEESYWMVLDETGSVESSNFPNELEVSDSEIEYLSDDVTACEEDKDTVTAMNFNRPYRKARTNDNGEAKFDSIYVAKRKIKQIDGKSDTRRDRESLKTRVVENAIIIDDDDEEYMKLETSVKNNKIKRKKAIAETVIAKKVKKDCKSSSKENLIVDKKKNRNSIVVDSESEACNDEEQDSDSVIEYKFEDEKIDKKDEKKANIKKKRITTCGNIATKEARKKRFDSSIDIKYNEESSDSDVTLLEDKIIVDIQDDEDMELETIKKAKRKEPKETAAAKRSKADGAPCSKKKLKLAEADKNVPLIESDDEKAELEIGKNNFEDKVDVEWTDIDYLVESNRIEAKVAENLISLFKNDNTIPFIARYRKEMTGGMEPEQLRNIKNTYDNIKVIKQRALVILRSIDKLGKWTPEIHSSITAAKTLNELEHIYAPFKPGAKGSLAERAKELGLCPIGITIMQGGDVQSLSSLVDKNRKGLRNEKEVNQGIVHIIADIISKDKTTFEGIHRFRKTASINIECTKSKALNSSKAKKNLQQNTDLKKYENYFNFTSSEKLIKDYQILAINRGESQKILSVKIILPKWFQQQLKDHCLAKYRFVKKVSKFHYDILEEGFEDAYNRLMKPLVTRQVRHDLNERATIASIEVFAGNLKKLLLTPPLRGNTILGIDPGFTHGCKLAVISQFGNVLDTEVIYPHTDCGMKNQRSVATLVKLIRKHNCKIVALGNATACRETETFLTNLIQNGVFAPVDVSYTIVNEAGASIYSCGSEAKSEFPNLDPNIISAISIARRLQDPIAELIKVEPKHLGIGMYQHDLPKKQLQITLDEVLMETVSFVGVDINTASHCLLRKVAGLSPARATNIISRRDSHGPFTNRNELLEVKGIGKKIFEQCAGFIRILPETALTGRELPSQKYPMDGLDQTSIHPESYDVARKFLDACNCNLNELGTENFIRKVASYGNKYKQVLANQFNTTHASIEIIIKGLSMRKGEDIRIQEERPLFRKNLKSINDLCVNTKLTGSVTNVTNFGAFVDIGIGRNGLIPLGKSKGQILSLGQRVEVVVLSIDKERSRVTLSL